MIWGWYTFFYWVLKKINPMITIHEFKASSFEKKCDLITNCTEFIASRTMEDTKTYLYYTGEFFVEVFYSTRYKKVLRIYAFNDAEGLVPYTEEVSLIDLLS
jgi:hypothetical protein